MVKRNDMDILNAAQTCKCIDKEHEPLCKYSRLRDTLSYLKREMLTSVRKLRDHERRFDEITDSYLNADDTHQYMSQKDKEYHAANDPKRKAASANAQYHIARATMFASVIDALS